VRWPSFIRSRRGRADDFSGGLSIALSQTQSDRRSSKSRRAVRARRATDRLYVLYTHSRRRSSIIRSILYRKYYNEAQPEELLIYAFIWGPRESLCVNWSSVNVIILLLLCLYFYVYIQSYIIRMSFLVYDSRSQYASLISTPTTLAGVPFTCVLYPSLFRLVPHLQWYRVLIFFSSLLCYTNIITVYNNTIRSRR